MNVGRVSDWEKFTYGGLVRTGGLINAHVLAMPQVGRRHAA